MILHPKSPLLPLSILTSVCTRCVNFYPQTSTNTIRKSQVSSRVPMIPCTKCNRRFRNSSGLKRHNNAIHGYYPGLDVPMTEFWQDHHPLLTGVHIFYIVSLTQQWVLIFLQPSDVMNVENSSPQMFHRHHWQYNQILIGSLSAPVSALNLPIFFLPKWSFQRKR